jgi:hypothetical protein
MIARNRWLPAVVVLLFAILGGASATAQEPPAEKKPLFKVERDGPRRESLAFTPASKRLACNLILRDLTGLELARGEVEGLPPCMYVACSPDGKRLAAVHFDDGLIDARHAISLWNLAADNKLQKLATLEPKKARPAHRRSMYFLTFSQDSSLLATREPDDSTTVWDAATGKERLRLDTQGLAVGFTPDGRTLTAVTRDGLVQHWDLATKKCVAAPSGAKREDYLFVVNAIASADGKTLALMDDYSVMLKDAKSGRTLRRFDNLLAWNVTLSADGKTLAATIEDRVVLFDRDTGKESPELKTGRASVEALALSADGKLLAVATNERKEEKYPYSVAVWEIAKLSAVRKAEVKRDTPRVPLEAKLTSKKDVYTLSLGGKTAEEFARQIGRGKLPPPLKVDLVLTLRNTGTKPLTIDPDVLLSLHLTGDGAMNHPMESYQTAGRLPESKKVTIAPGKTYEIPIQTLDRGLSEQSYWLLPGEYTLHAGCFLIVDPAPEGAEIISGTLGFVRLTAPPLRVKVAAEKK